MLDYKSMFPETEQIAKKVFKETLELISIMIEEKIEKEKNQNPKWIVCIKGDSGLAPFEIAVVKETYLLGRNSYGWFGENKILISHSAYVCKEIPLHVWEKLINLARKIATELNENN